MKALIVNGDDFGASRGINRGILEAHLSGILTSASLLVNAPGSEEAGELARRAPGLSVGLHFDLGGDPVRARDSRLRLRRELEDQLRRFEAIVGAMPTHLDSHHNVHRKLALLPCFLDFAREHAVPMREHSPVRYVSKFYGQWDGRTHLEQISVENLTLMLSTEIGEGISELACHPGYLDLAYATGYSVEREAEVRTLCAPSLRAVVAASAIRLASYYDLGRLLEECA
jgi:chitin disaccharide deacetylase